MRTIDLTPLHGPRRPLPPEVEFDRYWAKQHGNQFEDTEVKQEIQFIGSTPDVGLKILPPPPVPKVRVRVRAPYRIPTGDGIFRPGDEFDADHDDTTRHWLMRGWIELVVGESKTSSKEK